MKNKRVKMLCIVGTVVAVVVIAAIGVVIARGWTFSVGRCLVAKDNSYLLILDNSPIVMSDQSAGKNLFQNISTGDKILVVHDGILESYPGRTGAYACIWLGKGDADDISDEVRSSLSEMGWLSDGEESDALKSVGEAKVSHGENSITLKKLEGWEYEISEYEENVGFAISFWPKGQESGKLVFQYGPFGVCGTGLTERWVTIGMYQGNQGTYDNDEMWSFISFAGNDDKFVVLNQGAEVWWEEYDDEAMHILETAVFKEGAL